MATPTLAIRLSDHAFNATLAYLAAQWTQDGSVTVTAYPMRKVAMLSGIDMRTERITAAAIRTLEGRIFTGTLHCLAIESAERAGYTYNFDDGFLTTLGRYVDREVAKDIAYGRVIGAEPGDALLAEEIVM